MKTYESETSNLNNIALSGLLFFSVFFSLSLFLNQQLFPGLLFIVCTLLFIGVFLKNGGKRQQPSQFKFYTCTLLWISLATTFLLHPPSQHLFVYCLFPLSLATLLLVGLKQGVALSIPVLASTLYLSSSDWDISIFYLIISLITFLCLLGIFLRHVENLERSLEQAKTTDPLTGCSTISQFKKHIETSAELYRRHNTPVTCLIFNPNIKILQHQEKETFLKELAQICQSRIRQTDVICHYNDYCFLILLPSTTSNSADNLGNDLLQACKAYSFSCGVNENNIHDFQYELSNCPDNTSWEAWFNQLTQNGI